MDNLCGKCANYSKDYDSFRQEYYDVVKVGENTADHGCVMYDDHIPHDVWNGAGDCPYYIKKKKEGNG